MSNSIKDKYTLNIGSESELTIKPEGGGSNVIFSILNGDSIYSENLDIKKTFSFCDDIQEVVDLTFFTMKNRHFSTKITKQELFLTIKFNLGFKEKSVTIVLKKNSNTLYEEDLKREISLIKSDFDNKYRKLYDFYNDEISSLNKYCENMFRHILETMQNNSFKIQELGEKLSKKTENKFLFDLDDSVNHENSSLDFGSVSSIRYSTQKQPINIDTNGTDSYSPEVINFSSTIKMKNPMTKRSNVVTDILRT